MRADRTFFCAAALLVMASAATEDGATRVGAEAERLEKALLDAGVSDADFKSSFDVADASLARARAALDSGRVYLVLSELGKAQPSVSGLASLKDNRQAIAGGLPAFEAGWNKAGLALMAEDRKARERAWTNSPAAVRALAESAQGKTITLLQTSRAYAGVTDARLGFFYLGTARGAAAIASFCASLDLPRRGAPLAARSILPELQELQQRTGAAFVPPRSIDRHDDFIKINGALKYAGELDAATSYAGALYQYLEAVQQFGALDAVAPEPAARPQLRKALAAAEARLRSSQRDDSIAELFVQRAQTLLERKDGSEPAETDWKNAAIIVDQVLPAYEAALKRTSRPERAGASAATVTLVRWPFT